MTYTTSQKQILFIPKIGTLNLKKQKNEVQQKLLSTINIGTKNIINLQN